MRVLKLVMCVLLMAATDTVDAEIIKDLEFYESYDLLSDQSFNIEDQESESESDYE